MRPISFTTAALALLESTSWSERVALLGRSYVAMEGAFRTILPHVPFPILEAHPDNGVEFFNFHLRRFWGQAAAHIQLSRSHPYRKNDNRFVEQRNNTLVRSYLGHDRFDSVAQVHAINELYEKLWLYNNFFQPILADCDRRPVTCWRTSSPCPVRPQGTAADVYETLPVDTLLWKVDGIPVT